MSRWVLLLIPALAVAVLGPALASSAKSKQTCAVDFHGRIAQVRVDGGNPPLNGSETDAGILDGKFCGKTVHGATRVKNTYPALGKFKAKTVSFGPLGAIRADANGSGTAHADGSVSFSGSGKFTGGTSIFKHATGSFTVTGNTPKNSKVSTEHIKGTVKF